MTTPLHPVPSGSGMPEPEFAVSASVTNPPYLSSLIGWFVDNERSLRVGFYDDALTAVDIVPVLRAPPRGGLEVLYDEQDLVDGYLGRPAITAYQVPVSGLSEGSVFSFSLEVKGGTSLGYVKLGEHPFDSPALGSFEVVPEMLQEALDAPC